MEFWKLIYVASLVILALSLVVLVVRWPLSIHVSFSAHAAQRTSLSIYYFFIFFITLPAISLFMFQWFTFEWTLSIWVPVVFLLVTLTQIICTFFPEKRNPKQTLIHQLFAGASALLLFVCSLLITLSVSGFAQVVCFVGALLMAVVLLLAVILKAKYSLILQTVYYLGFFVPVLILTFIK